MFAFCLKYYQYKCDVLRFTIIYQLYASLLLSCVNSESLLSSTETSLKGTVIEMASLKLESKPENESKAEGPNFGVNSSSNQKNISINGSNYMCGNTQKMADNCFRDLPPHLMEFLQTSKIAINEEDIVSKCNVFRRGMQCFDDYTSRCIPPHNINILNNNVEGAKKFFTKFCEDKTFQKDYLSHKECFTYIQDDWMRCTKTFQIILAEGLHSGKNISEKFLEFCCARYAYETCIYNSARYKCYQSSAAFARATAQMLSDEKHFSNCRQFEISTCNGSSSILQIRRCHYGLWVGLTLLFILRYRR